MRLYIREKVFSWADKFFVKDEQGNDRYVVEGEVFTWGKKLHVYDMAGTEVAFIKQEIWSWLPKYYVYRGEQPVAEVQREFSFFYPRYTVKGPEWEVTGDFFDHDYSITQGARSVVNISKAWMSWGDNYLLDIADPRDEILALATVLIIDCVRESEQSSSN